MGVFWVDWLCSQALPSPWWRDGEPSILIFLVGASLGMRLWVHNFVCIEGHCQFHLLIHLYMSAVARVCKCIMNQGYRLLSTLKHTWLTLTWPEVYSWLVISSTQTFVTLPWILHDKACIICDMQNVVLATPIFCFPPAVRSCSQCIAHARLVSQTHLRKWVWLARLSACSSLLV